MPTFAVIYAAVNIYDVQGNMEGAARLVTFAIGIAVVLLVAEKFWPGGPRRRR